MTEQKTYAGQLSLRVYGDSEDVLYLSTREEPLARVLEEEISGKVVSVRYWVIDKEVTKEQAQGHFQAELAGAMSSIFSPVYSEITGYLWTDEEIKVGGHDLLAELEGYIGKWLILEVDIHDRPIILPKGRKQEEAS